MSTSEKMHSEENQFRLFIAYPLPKLLWSEAEAICANNKSIANIRWTPLQNLHLTVFFLGETNASNLNEIRNKIRSEASAHPPFKIKFNKVSFERGRKHSGMIWLRFFKNTGFSSLAFQLGKSLEEFLLNPVAIADPVPHITLARWKGELEIERMNIETESDFQLPAINFCELWQTIRLPAGVRYESLERFELKEKI